MKFIPLFLLLMMSLFVTGQTVRSSKKTTHTAKAIPLSPQSCVITPIGSSNPTCAGLCNGTFSLDLSGCTNPPFTIQWLNPGPGAACQTLPPFEPAFTGTTYTVNTLCGCGTASSVLVENALGEQNIISVSVFSPGPPIAAVSSKTVCEYSSTTFTAIGSAISYTWNTGANTQIVSVLPATTTVYTVTGTDVNNCVGSKTVSATVNTSCRDVWPGDANSDGTADNLDILELGLHYTNTGAARSAGISNNWQSYNAATWSGTLSTGDNVNHSDCNGDGLINDDDTTAIWLNYGSSHAFKQNPSSVNTGLTMIPDQAQLLKGTWGTASVYLGDTANPVTGYNGVAFTLTYDTALIEHNQIWIEYPVSFLNTSNQNLHFRKQNTITGRIYTATTHKLNAVAIGSGKIARLHYKAKSTLAGNQILTLTPINAYYVGSTGTITPLGCSGGTVALLSTDVGIKEYTAGALISISPNPASDRVTVSSSGLFNKIELINYSGETVLTEKVNTTSFSLDLKNVASGIYFLAVTNSPDATRTFHKLIVRH